MPSRQFKTAAQRKHLVQPLRCGVVGRVVFCDRFMDQLPPVMCLGGKVDRSEQETENRASSRCVHFRGLLPRPPSTVKDSPSCTRSSTMFDSTRTTSQPTTTGCVDLVQAFERSIDRQRSAHPPRDNPMFWWQLSLVTHGGPGSGTYLHYVIPFVFSPPSSSPKRTGHPPEFSRHP